MTETLKMTSYLGLIRCSSGQSQVTIYLNYLLKSVNVTDPIFSDIFPYHYFGHLGGQSEVSETHGSPWNKTWELTQKSSL